MKLSWTVKDTVRGDGGLVEFGDAEVIVILGDSGGIDTRGDGGVTVRTAGCGGTMLGSAGFAMAL